MKKQRFANLRILWRVIKTMNAEKIFSVYIIYLCSISCIFPLIEPQIETVGDGFWFCFTMLTTIGFGDYTAVTPLGRTLSVIFGIASLFVVALLTGVVVSMYQEKSKIKAGDSVQQFMDDLENLPSLPKERLAEISDKVRNFKSARGGEKNEL